MSTKTLQPLLLLALFSISLPAAQSTLGLNINQKDLEVTASLNLNSYADYSDSTTYLMNAYYIHLDNDDTLFSVSIGGHNNFQGIEGLGLGFGAKGVFADEFAALPLFGEAAYILPFNAMVPTTVLKSHIAYAPAVLSFREAKSYTEFRTELNMEVITNIHLFAGYRNIVTEYTTVEKTFNSSYYGGMKLSF